MTSAAPPPPPRLGARSTAAPGNDDPPHAWARPSSTSSLPSPRRLLRFAHHGVPRAASGFIVAPSRTAPAGLVNGFGSHSVDASPASSSPPSPAGAALVTADKRAALDAPLSADELALALRVQLKVSNGGDATEPNATDMPELLLLDTRNFMAFNASHVRGSHNLNIPPVLLRRYLRALEDGTGAGDGVGGRARLSSIFLSDQSKEHFAQRQGKTVVLIDDYESARACSVLLDMLRADEQIADVCRLDGGFADFQRLYPELCDYPPQHQHPQAVQAPPNQSHPTRAHTACGDAHMALSVPTQPAPAHPQPQHAPGPARFRQLNLSLPVAHPSEADLSDQRYVPPSEVFPWLYMGSDEDAADAALLQRLRVRYIVNAARECSNHHEGEFVYKNMAADDRIDEGHAFEEQVKEMCAFIATVKTRGDGAVFVHCRAGVSRSATVVIAFLQLYEGFSYDGALDYVRQRRPCVNPNLGFLCMLMQLPPGSVHK